MVSMFYFFSFVFIILVFSILIYLLNFDYSHFNSYKSSSFECGFFNISEIKEMFSFPFFLISLMFLLFDVEILLLCFLPLTSFMLGYSSYMVVLVLGMIFLSTMYEWFKGILIWV